jgi:predicted metal-dependent hydrolase
MADITVRKLRLDFEECQPPNEIDLDFPDEDLLVALGAFGISLTMPYLEPYLIRTMKVALPQIKDESLANDVRLFSQQEGHHFRNHMKYNEHLRARFAPDVAAQLVAIEQDLEADYQRFTRDESLRFNVAYAEGFEALTCGLALASAEHRAFPRLPAADLFAWHMAEEIEHRTVAFDLFEHLVGSYTYRIRAGCWAQWHYLRTVDRFVRVIATALGRKLTLQFRPLERAVLRNYVRTLSPRYNPANIEIPPVVDELLEEYARRAAR